MTPAEALRVAEEVTEAPTADDANERDSTSSIELRPLELARAGTET